MLLAALFGMLFFSLVLLVFPPQNPVAFLFIVPAVMITAVAVGFGLTRISPEAFLRTPVIVGLGAVMLVAMGVMSMPNLRQAMRRLPARIDLTLVDAPTPVTFASSNDIDFVDTKDGEARIWYADRSGGGYDLFRAQGVGPYYARDGRRLTKADNESIRLKIAASVDREAAATADALRKADLAAAERKAEEKTLAAREATERAEHCANRSGSRQSRAVWQTSAWRNSGRRPRDWRTRSGVRVICMHVICQARSISSSLQRRWPGCPWIVLPQRWSSRSQAEERQPPTSCSLLRSSRRGGADLQDMPVVTMGDRLFLARVNVNSVKPGTSAAGLFSASVIVTFSVLASNDGRIVDGFELNAVGAGTSEADATSTALDRILELLGQRGY